MDSCQDKIGVQSMVFINPKDVVFDKFGNFIRMKRKYGKHKRTVYKKEFKSN